MWFIAILLAFVVLSSPVLALETLSNNHFTVEYDLTPREEECFTGGEKINLNYEIFPKSSAYRVLLGGEENNPRTYYFKTNLSDPSWRLIIYYYHGGIWDEEKGGKEASIEAKYFKIGTEEKGIAEITAKLTAIVPICIVRLCDFVAINASCEDCERGALPDVKIKVANENAFKADIKSLRAKMSEVEQKLKSENLYNEEDFKGVKSSIDSAESFLLSKKFLEADAKIIEANELLNKLQELANKKLAEMIYSEVNKIVSNNQNALFNSSVLLEKLRDHQNYTKFLLEYKVLEGELNDLKNSMRNVESLISANKFTSAIDELKKIEINATSLNGKLMNFTSTLLLELENPKSSSWLPYLPYGLNLIILLIVFGFFGALFVFVALKLRKRRKWDELR